MIWISFTRMAKNLITHFIKISPFAQDYVPYVPRTHDGMDLNTLPMRAVYVRFSLEANTIDFIGHALALHRDEKYLDEPALPTIKRIKLYADSLARYLLLTRVLGFTRQTATVFLDTKKCFPPEYESITNNSLVSQLYRIRR